MKAWKLEWYFTNQRSQETRSKVCNMMQQKIADFKSCQIFLQSKQVWFNSKAVFEVIHFLNSLSFSSPPDQEHCEMKNTIKL